MTDDQMSLDEITGRYTGPNPTPSEEESGTVIERQNRGPLKPGSPGHQLLWEFRDGERMTAYEASHRACGTPTHDGYHDIRREIGRLEERKFALKVVDENGEYVLWPNPAPRGRKHVHVYLITEAGKADLVRLGSPTPHRRDL